VQFAGRVILLFYGNLWRIRPLADLSPDWSLTADIRPLLVVDARKNENARLDFTPEPKPVPVGIAGAKGRLSPAAEKFWQCAKGAASQK